MASFHPSAKTLAKYGLSLDEWDAILARQGGVCAICGLVPNGRFCIDHEHVKGFKKLPPEKRKRFVRGLLCWYDNNRFVSRGITVRKAQAVVAYLLAHEKRILEYALSEAA